MSTIQGLLLSRGVAVIEIAEIVFLLQSPYNNALTLGMCEESVNAVLQKREVQYALYTGIALDELAEQRKLPSPLQEIMQNDESLYGVDETLALSITHVYGMIGLTSFGYLDKLKPLVLQKLNNKGNGVHVFLDDLVAGIAAAASARIAHNNPNAMIYDLPSF